MRKVDERTIRMASELQQFFADYWSIVDEKNGEGASEFYAEDCICFLGSKQTAGGRTAMAAFYRSRAEHGARTTRHMSSNFRVIPDGDSSAEVSFVIANFASDGLPPIQGLGGPAVILQVKARCERDTSGYWHIKRLQADPMFIGNEPYSSSQLAHTKRT